VVAAGFRSLLRSAPVGASCRHGPSLLRRPAPRHRGRLGGGENPRPVPARHHPLGFDRRGEPARRAHFRTQPGRAPGPGTFFGPGGSKPPVARAARAGRRGARSVPHPPGLHRPPLPR
jgi:hypothetical protein